MYFNSLPVLITVTALVLLGCSGEREPSGQPKQVEAAQVGNTDVLGALTRAIPKIRQQATDGYERLQIEIVKIDDGWLVVALLGHSDRAQMPEEVTIKIPFDGAEPMRYPSM